MIVELEVEIVRTEKIYFEWDPNDTGMGMAGIGQQTGGFLRKVQFHMHSAKSLIRRESPKLLSWRGMDETDIFGSIRWSLDGKQLQGTCIDPDCECGGYVFEGEDTVEISRKASAHRQEWGVGTF